MELDFYYHRHSDLLINHDKSFISDFKEIIDVLVGIKDRDLILEFEKSKAESKSTKSLARTINSLIKERLEVKDWLSEVGLFKDPPYSKKNRSRWRLDFAKNNISIEVAFNHQEATAHNILKPVLASELNHVKKEIQTRMGVIIVADKEMKDAGNFDGAIGTFESFQEYFKPYSNIITTPIVLIGLKKPHIFYIDKLTKNIVLK